MDLFCGRFERVRFDGPGRLRKRTRISVPVKQFTRQHLQPPEPLAPRSPLTPQQNELFQQFENWRKFNDEILRN